MSTSYGLFEEDYMHPLQETSSKNLDDINSGNIIGPYGTSVVHQAFHVCITQYKKWTKKLRVLRLILGTWSLFDSLCYF
jgi:hypothetical protein